MLDEQDGDVELIADLRDVLHQLLRLVRVHARRRFIQQQQRRIGGQCADDFQAALRAVGQAARLMIGQILHIENAQQVERALVHFALAAPIPRHAENAGKHAVAHLIVQADAHVVLHGHIVEQPDVLECAGDAQLVGLRGVHARRVAAVEHDRAHRRLIHLGQQVEHGGLARAVRADQTGDFRLADNQVEILDGMQAAEVNPQIPRLQHGALVEIALGDDAVARRRNHSGRGALFVFRHASSASFFRPFPRGMIRSTMPRSVGLFVASMTRISTMA